MDRQDKIILGVGGGVLLIILFFLFSFRTVGVGQVGVLTSFGNVKRIAQSGVLIKAPVPFEQLAKFDIRTQKDQTDADASSKDLQDVKVTLVTNYAINNEKVGDLYRTVGTNYKASIIDPAIQESIKATTAEFNASELITNRPQLKANALKALQTRLAPRGITVQDISITNIQFSAEFNRAIEAKQVAQQQAEQAVFAAQKATQDAQAEVNKAQGDAQAQALRQTTLTPELLEQQAIGRWNGVMPTTITGDAGNIFSIPLK